MKLLLLLAVPLLAQQADQPKKAVPKPHVAAHLPTVGWRPPAETSKVPKPVEQKPNVSRRPPFAAWRPAPNRTLAAPPAAAKTPTSPAPQVLRNSGHREQT